MYKAYASGWKWSHEIKNVTSHFFDVNTRIYIVIFYIIENNIAEILQIQNKNALQIEERFYNMKFRTFEQKENLCLSIYSERKIVGGG